MQDPGRSVLVSCELYLRIECHMGIYQAEIGLVEYCNQVEPNEEKSPTLQETNGRWSYFNSFSHKKYSYSHSSSHKQCSREKCVRMRVIMSLSLTLTLLACSCSHLTLLTLILTLILAPTSSALDK